MLSDVEPITHPRDTVPGLNHIRVSSVQYGEQKMLMEKEVAIPTRDGDTLYANVFRPAAEARCPVVLCADVYGNDSINMETVRFIGIASPGTYETSLFAPWEAPDPGFWVPNGYVLVKAGLRGSAGNVGRMDYFSETEAQDFYDIIEWAAAQPWSDGNIGTNGVSYLAMSQWRVGPLQPPSLKAMIPWEGASDIYREWCNRGGIPDTGFVPGWLGVQRRRWPDIEMEDLFKAETDHPLWDEFWAARVPKLEDITVPLLVGGGWATQGLHTRGSVEGFSQASSQAKWLDVHGRKEWETYYSRECLERQLRFFDHFLKGEDNGWDDTPPVRYEVRDRLYQGEVRTATSWPPEDVEFQSYYLNGADGTLQDAAPESASVLRYPSKEGAASFDLRFDVTTEVTGPMQLTLWLAALDADDADVFVAVDKLDRDGRRVPFPDLNHIETGRVAYGWLRASHRELDVERSRPGQPWHRHQRALSLTPGEPVQLDVEILPSSTLFHAGEALRLTVQGVDLPFTGETGMRYRHENSVNNGDHALHCGGSHQARLLLPVRS